MFTIFNFKKNDYVSPGSIGAKIKKIREYRGLTQKELGLRCGFTETTADVRIRQYESNKKVPREKALKTLTEALEIDECALFDTDLLVESRARHALFDIEDLHGLHPVEIDGHYYLDFSGTTSYGSEVQYYQQAYFLDQWFKMRQKCTPSKDDSDEEILKKRMEYDLWRYEYPINESKKSADHMMLRHKKELLEKQLQDINKQLNSNDYE